MGYHIEIGLLLVTALPCQDAAAGAQGSKETPYTITGTLDLKYVGRWTDGARDHDVFGYTAVNIGDSRTHTVTGHFSGRAAWDLDRDRDPTHPFRSADDSRSGDVTGRLYRAYVDVNRAADIAKRVRIGRQTLYETPRTLFLDGIAVETPPARDWGDLDVLAYVGVPSHIFEASPNGDYAAGGAMRFGPWTGARVRVDFMHVTDEYFSTTTNDDLIGVRLDQRIGREFFVNAHVNAYDFEDVSDVGAFVSWMDPDNDFNVTVRYSGLVDDEKRRSIDLDYYTEILARYVAYDQYDVMVHKGVGDTLYVEGGAQLRELRHDAKESLFNHEFRRYHALVGGSEWPWAGADVSVTYELWDSQGDRSTSFGADFTHKHDDTWSGSLGTFFQLFRYDPLRGTEDEDVQVTYLKLNYNMSARQRLRARLEFEDGERDDFYTLALGMQTDF